MSLMGSLFTGVSGLQTSQNSLNTTAHNLSNIGTTGYVRQQSLQATAQYATIQINTKGVSDQQVGLGVVYAKVRQVRDQFLDQTYRRESGRSSFYNASSNAIAQAEGLLGELQDSSFSESVGDLWTAVQELAKNPASSTCQTLLVQRASQFLNKSQTIYKGLSDYQDNLNDLIKTKTDRINEIGRSLFDCNLAISQVESAGIETANDLRDTRNSLLDELSGLANISYENDPFGNTCVKIEGNDFVTTSKCYQIELDIDASTGFYTPYWPQCSSWKEGPDGEQYLDTSSAHVFHTTGVISSATDTDIGEVKSLLMARGDHRANYTDLADKEHYDNDISQSIVMNIQSEFDQLVHSIATEINKVLEEACDPANNYLCDEDGSPLQLFQKITNAGYTFDGTDWNYVPEDPEKTESLYTTANLTVNSYLVKQPSALGFIRPDGSEDFTTAKKLVDIFQAEKYTLNPNLKTEYNFTDYYSALVSQVANTGSVMDSICTSQELTVKNTDAARDQIMGVSSEEELNNMIKFQNAYNAASRYMNVIDEMLEHIITTLGM